VTTEEFGIVTPITVRAEPVEALFFLSAAREGQGFDKLSPNGNVGAAQ
jgi:hypothetical protein